MSQIRLIPSSSAVSNTQYASIASASNMYANTDSTTHGTFTHNRESTNNTYYGYIRGFNISSVPSDAIVNSFTIKIKASATGHTTSTSSSYRMGLINNTTQIGSTTVSTGLSTSTQTFTFPNGSLTWDQIVNYGSNFGIRIPLRRANSSTADVVSVYGAEILVDYTVPVYHNITVQNSTSATVESSETSVLEGNDVVISTNTLTGITITDNNTDITNQFSQATGGTISQTAHSPLESSFTDSGGKFYISSSSTTTQYLEYAIGHTAESPGNTGTQNTYVKGSASGNSTRGDAIYSFDFSSIPSSATITSITVKCYGAVEDSSQSTSHADITLYSGSTQKSTTQSFTSSSNSIITISNPGTWTATELHSAKLHFTLGYYGGRLFGITWSVTYTVSGYVYTISNVTADHIIVVSATGNPTIYFKSNGSWVAAAAVYKKVNGSWVLQSNLSNVFDNNTNYVKG